MTSKGLEFWDAATVGPGLADDAAYAAMIGHAHFSDACRLTARTSLARFDLATGRLGRDGASLFYAIFALYLDARGGLTLTAIQQFCEGVGLASPGRAAAMLIQMRLMGYIKRDPAPKDKRVRRYLPTEEMREHVRRNCRDELEAVALIEPDAHRVGERLDEPEIFTPYLLKLGAGLEQAIRRKEKSPLSIFIERNGGLLVLYHMCLSGEDGDVYPPRGPVRMAAVDLTKRFGISRSHVFRMLRDAEKTGLLTRHADEATGMLSETMRAELNRFHAGFYMGNAACAYHALHPVKLAA